MTLTAPSMPDLASSRPPMKFSAAIDLYISDMRQAGRLNSDGSEYGYRRCLELHGEDVLKGRLGPSASQSQIVEPNLDGEEIR